jgi:hypothetical protein
MTLAHSTPSFIDLGYILLARIYPDIPCLLSLVLAQALPALRVPLSPGLEVSTGCSQST